MIENAGEGSVVIQLFDDPALLGLIYTERWQNFVGQVRFSLYRSYEVLDYTVLRGQDINRFLKLGFSLSFPLP